MNYKILILARPENAEIEEDIYMKDRLMEDGNRR